MALFHVSFRGVDEDGYRIRVNFAGQSSCHEQEEQRIVLLRNDIQQSYDIPCQTACYF